MHTNLCSKGHSHFGEATGEREEGGGEGGDKIAQRLMSLPANTGSVPALAKRLPPEAQLSHGSL